MNVVKAGKKKEQLNLDLPKTIDPTPKQAPQVIHQESIIKDVLKMVSPLDPIKQDSQQIPK